MTRSEKIKEIKRLVNGNSPVLLQEHCDLINQYSAKKYDPGVYDSLNGIVVCVRHGDKYFDDELKKLPALHENILIIRVNLPALCN